MRKSLLFITVMLMLVSSASAATLTQSNDSLVTKNFSTSLSAQNFTMFMNVPANSTVSASWIGSLRGPAYEVIASKDQQVTNFSGYRDSVSNSLHLSATYPPDQARRNSYVYFNTSIDMSLYGSIEMVLPYQSPGSGDLLGHFNVTIYEVFPNATDWNENTLTWNNQPCGVGHVPNGTFCNSSYTAIAQVIGVDTTDYNCSSDRLRFNITGVAKKRKSNVSFLVQLDRNASYTGFLNAIDFCSRETGLNIFNNQSFPTQPSLYFGRFLYPSNVTVWINNSVANVTTSTLNSTNRLNLTLNASLSDNLSRTYQVSPLPVTFQVGGPGIVEISSFVWVYNVNNLIPAIQFNNTAPYVTSWSQGTANFIRAFVINNTGTADAKNCSLVTTISSGNSLAPYLSWPNNFSVVNQSSANINVTVSSPIDGFYDNLINVRCSAEGTSGVFETSTPINFVFSISSPSSSSGGGGGGSVTVLEVTNTTIILNPRLADLFYLSLPTSNGAFSFTTFSNVKIKSCEVQQGYECVISPAQTSATLKTNIPHSKEVSKTLNTQVVITGEAGQVGVVPVRIRVIYASFPTIALGIVGILGAAWVIRKGM